MIYDIEKIKETEEKEKKDWESLIKDKSKIIIQKLFSNELKGTDYKKYNLDELKNIITKKFDTYLQEIQNFKNPDLETIKTQKKITNLFKKIEKTTNIEDLLMLLDDYLFENIK